MAKKKANLSASERVSSGVFPTGVAYADRTVEVQGDYKRLAFLPFSTLVLEWVAKRVPPDVREYIERDAAKIQARRGQQYQVSTVGHTVILGGSGSSMSKGSRSQMEKEIEAAVRSPYRTKWNLYDDANRLVGDVSAFSATEALRLAGGPGVAYARLAGEPRSKAPRPTPYRIKLTPSEMSAVEHARGRYEWPDVLASHAAEDGSIALTESDMSQWCDDVDADDGRFSLASPALASKLEDFYGSRL